MVGNEVNSSSPWVTLKEASELTGRNINSLRQLLSGRQAVKVKKVKSSGQGNWLFHKDSLNGIMLTSSPDRVSQTGQKSGIPLEYFDSKQKEWTEERDKLQAGLMMYRFKFEELNRQIRLLPAPAEVITSQLMETEEALKAEVELREKLTSALQEKEAKIEVQKRQFLALGAELMHERSLPWWKKIFRRQG